MKVFWSLMDCCMDDLADLHSDQSSLTCQPCAMLHSCSSELLWGQCRRSSLARNSLWMPLSIATSARQLNRMP